MDKEQLVSTAFDNTHDIYNKTIEATPLPDPNIGIDVDNNMLSSIMEDAVVESTTLSKLQSFTSVTRTRNELYDTLDYMSQDTTLASVLETYAEDATEMNDSGHIMWCESDDPLVGKYISYLLDSLNVDKHLFTWTHSLCKYGDVYLRLYRESEVEDKFFSKSTKKAKKNNSLNEDVNIFAYSSTDKYVHYLEQAPNPAQLFELTRFGKTAGYVKTHIESQNNTQNQMNYMSSFDFNKYRFDSNDVDLFPATEWVHGCLSDDATRTPETVELFDSQDESSAVKYTVRKGQSLLYDSYKTWRELMLLENSVLLNRVTQSSIVRVIGVEVGDMPKESVQPHLMNIKNMIEQRTALDVGKGISEYTNPGPIVNNIYIPTRNNQGVLSTQQIGGDVNVGDLVDLNYYEDKLFGGLRVPKQYFGRTDDAAGFNGGSSLSLISSRYAKMIKRIQNVIIQMITDAINLILIDTDNASYINKFTLRMLSPTTQEEVDRRDNMTNKVALVSDVMNTLTDIQDTTLKLKILKSLLSDTLSNTDVVSYIQEEIDNLEAEEDDQGSEDELDSTFDAAEDDLGSLFGDDTENTADKQSDMNSEEASEQTDNMLPTPDSLGVGDFSDSTNPEFD